MDEEVVTPAEWTIVIILCFVNIINYMDRFTIAGVLTSIKDEFRINDSESGLLQTAFIGSYMIFAPLFGFLGDRYNRKIIISFGVFLWSSTTFVGSYMRTYEWFLFFRMLVGVGEASYSTIAPTIISDLFVKNVRSNMLAMFYFAIPVGSGLGYITGGEMSRAMNEWRWGLRLTPFLGLIAVVLILLLVRDPARGEKEGSHLSNTSWWSDINGLRKNPSFMLSTAGFTCVAFVTGAMAFWGPTFIEYGLQLQSKDRDVKLEDVSYIFGSIAMIAGLVGVPLGAMLSQKLKVRWPNADPVICAVGLLISSPFLFFAAVFANTNSLACYTCMFFGQLSLNINWSIVADILLYVVIPTRRSTAEAFQILFAHAFGDAGSPYLIGVISDTLKNVSLPGTLPVVKIGTTPLLNTSKEDVINFRSLQYALFVTIFVEVLGSLFFFFNAVYIETDKANVDLAIASTK